MKPTAQRLILNRLANADRALAVHELGIAGVSDNAAATRLSEMARSGLVEGWRVPGKAYKVWRLLALPALVLGADPT